MLSTLEKSLLVIAATVGIWLALPAPARADRCADERAQAESGKKNYKTVIGPDGRKIFVIQKAFVVCGKVPRPTVIYVLQASTINYKWENLKKDFLPKITNVVDEEPF
ncbi:MAG TPA: hypothetical protein VFG83_16975 [Kofleriaceae bacterium]|nr:hypothetical protein [Kofleriaceae bacterium]